MAPRTPGVVQNENVTIDGGKDGLMKADLLKPAKTGLKERKALREHSNTRKALRDLSNTGKPPVSGVTKGAALKEKSGILRAPEAIKNASKSSFQTDEEIKKCREWAKEGTEQTKFTGNDVQEMQKELVKKRVKKKVDKVMPAVHGQPRSIYDLALPVKETAEDIDDVKEMELEPEVALPRVDGRLSRSSDKLFGEAELSEPLSVGRPVDIKLKDFSYSVIQRM